MRRRSFAAPSMSSERTASLLWATSRSRSARRAMGATTSAAPVAMAFCGMEENSASAGSCTMTTPPASLTERTPCAPSAPEPESTMATPSPRAERTPCAPSAPEPESTMATPSPRALAIEQKKRSMGARCPRGSLKGRELTLSPSITSSRSGAMTYTQFGSRCGWSVTWLTLILVQTPSTSFSALGCSGERCRMTT